MTAEQSASSISNDRGTDSGQDAEVREAARLAEVARYGVIGHPPDSAFGRIAALAARLLNTPFAIVSIVDSEWIWFKATYGLDGVERTERAPGLCASTILQDEPHVVPNTLADRQTADNPLVRGDRGIRFYAAAPIITSEGHRLGAVAALDTRPREVSDEDLATLQDLAAVVMDELDLRLSALTTLRHERELREQSERDRATIEGFASTLQHTLLPPSLPEVPGIEVACHYYAAHPREVTGDFYDVFSLGDGRWAFFLGDVSGHGAAAATVASLTRYTLRAAALHNPNPAAALEELNALLLMDQQVRQSCTVLFGLAKADPTGAVDIVLAGGGHPPALWLRPDREPGSESGSVEEVWPAGGMLLGALPDARFATANLRLEAGQSLLLYTDGLTEARPNGEFFGEERLTAFVRERAGATANEVVADLTKLLQSFDPPPTDDVALLALSVPTEDDDTR